MCIYVAYICNLNIIPVYTETCHMHEYNAKVHTRHTYMHGYTLACVHMHTDTNIHLYVCYTAIYTDSTCANKYTTVTGIETH